jgi:DNA polymerase-3 subunit delta'
MAWNLVGHDWAVSLLARHIQTSNVKHAYLFCGPEGIGRRSLALRFAQALTCQNKQSPAEPCLACQSCQRFFGMQHPDLFIISAPDPGREIRIEQIRGLQHDLSLAPYEAPYRIGLLLDFQNANANAQNAMLKTLEEPTSRTILLLTASRPEDLLPTIASRCEVVLLRAASIDVVAKQLEKREGVEKDKAFKIASLSGGCYGYALTLNNNPTDLERINYLIHGLLQAMSATLHERFTYAEELTGRKTSARENLNQALKIWLSFWRDTLIVASGGNTAIINSEFKEAIFSLAKQVSLAEIHKQMTRLEAGIEKLDKNVNTRLLAEVLLMELPHIRPPVHSPV